MREFLGEDSMAADGPTFLKIAPESIWSSNQLQALDQLCLCCLSTSVVRRSAFSHLNMSNLLLLPTTHQHLIWTKAPNPEMDPVIICLTCPVPLLDYFHGLTWSEATRQTAKKLCAGKCMCKIHRLDDWCGCIVIVAINHYEPYFWNPPITVPQMTLEKMYDVSTVHSLNVWMWAQFRCYGLHCWKGVTHDCLSDWKSEELNFNAACYLDMYPIDCLPIIVICAVSWLTECQVFKTTTADKHWALSPESSITMMWFAGCSF